MEINTIFKSKDFGEKVVSLPHKWIHTNYDLSYWNFEFDVKTNQDFGVNHYKTHIENIYNNSKNIFGKDCKNICKVVIEAYLDAISEYRS